MDNVKDKPLVPPISPIARMEPSNHDTLQDSERKRPEHQALAASFCAQASPDYHVTRSIPAAQQSLLVYDYDRRSQQIKLIRN